MIKEDSQDAGDDEENKEPPLDSYVKQHTQTELPGEDAEE